MEATSGRSAGGRLSWGRLALGVLVAAVGAAVANAAVYFLASALGFLPGDVAVGPEGQALNLFAVVSASALGAVGAGVLLAVLNVFLRRPVRVFLIVSAVVLVASFYTPFTIPGAPAAMVLTLGFMHVVAAAVILGVLATLPRR